MIAQIVQFKRRGELQITTQIGPWISYKITAVDSLTEPFQWLFFILKQAKPATQ